MGERGPARQRSDQVRRRNKREQETVQVELATTVERPAPSEDWHPTARGWYDSLTASGQSRYYEPSDWFQAHFCADLMHKTLTGSRINAQLVAAIRGLMTDLLTSEASRRRANIEVIRKDAPDAEPSQESSDNVTRMDERRRRVTDAS